MTNKDDGAPNRCCPKTGRTLAHPRRQQWLMFFWWISGTMALFWFLVRVLPKPSRAAYPCQRAAAPWASAFVVWLFAVVGSAHAWRRLRECGWHSKRTKTWAALLASGVTAAVALVHLPESSGWADAPTPGAPQGVAKGIHPGRVVWVHAPDATDWAGFSSPEPWWRSNHTDLATVEAMVSEAVRQVAGEATDAAAWDALFNDFNAAHGQGRRSYRAGEKVVVKINLTACNARGEQVDPVTYEKKPAVMNTIDNSPQMLLALLRQLVYAAGVAPGDICLGDPTGLFPNFMWEMLHSEFPEVHYFDNLGGAGRLRTEFSAVPIYWSTTNADGKLPDFLPTPFAQADYLINFAVLKGHAAGVSLCGKNLYGALLRCPDGYLRNAGVLNYYDLHLSLPCAGWSPGTGRYRALVDLMGHPQLGGKTLLCLIDGLFAGYYWDSHPYPWKSPPFGDGTNSDWPSSLFASQDPVAIDSVAYDFLLNEWPKVVQNGQGPAGSLQGGADDYLLEAALGNQPPSGTFYDPARSGHALTSLGVHEHWNNPVARQYSRNQGLNEGIELVSLRVNRPAARLSITRHSDGMCLAWPSAQVGFRLERSLSLSFPDWQPVQPPPVFFQGQNVVTNAVHGLEGFYRLAQ